MTTLNLPEPIAAYFEADRRDADALTRCFASTAVVQDEGRAFRGLAAIRAWKAASAEKYTYTSEPLGVEGGHGEYVVTSRLTGNFPGSPVNLRFAFRLEGDKITALEIGK